MTGSDVRSILPQNIKRFREIRRFSQAELAFGAGISIPFLSDIERENKWPHPDTLAQIATALEIEVFELFIPPADIEKESRTIISQAVTEILDAQKKVAEDIVQKYARIESASIKSII